MTLKLRAETDNRGDVFSSEGEARRGIFLPATYLKQSENLTIGSSIENRVDVVMLRLALEGENKAGEVVRIEPCKAYRKWVGLLSYNVPRLIAHATKYPESNTWQDLLEQNAAKIVASVM